MEDFNDYYSYPNMDYKNEIALKKHRNTCAKNRKNRKRKKI